MKIRATKKLLTISRIKEIKDTHPLIDDLPGEWYASLVSMGLPGKHAIHFLHFPTLISIILPGKSINKAIPILPDRISSLLDRHGYAKLIPFFKMNSSPEITATNNRSILAYLNDRKYTIQYHLSNNRSLDSIEDIEFRNLFGGKLANDDYITPDEILTKYLKKMVSC